MLSTWLHASNVQLGLLEEIQRKDLGRAKTRRDGNRGLHHGHGSKTHHNSFLASRIHRAKSDGFVELLKLEIDRDVVAETRHANAKVRTSKLGLHVEIVDNGLDVVVSQFRLESRIQFGIVLAFDDLDIRLVVGHDDDVVVAQARHVHIDVFQACLHVKIHIHSHHLLHPHKKQTTNNILLH